MVQKHSPLGRLHSTIELALANFNSSLDMASRQLPSKLEDLIQAKFDELAAKMAPQEDVDEHEDETEAQQDITETISQIIDKRFADLQANLERKIDNKFNTIIAKLEAMDTSTDILRIENRLAIASSSVTALTN
ncbi:hypothetical protein O0L34_g14456 [Tuta absoluta]|nr:hypothetical protein O0L34_g14456 [Tuta absoluta]